MITRFSRRWLTAALAVPTIAAGLFALILGARAGDTTPVAAPEKPAEAVVFGPAQPATAPRRMVVDRNHAPFAQHDLYRTTSGDELVVVAGGVLANDEDVNGDALTATLFDLPTHGSLTLAPDGSFAYTPEAGFLGVDHFTYRAADGASASELRTVTIRVS